jgi:RNA polymerase sigma-70 factor (sigma-E family)
VDNRAEREFRDFVEARSLALLRTAYVLTGDQHLAEDLVQTALAKLAARWGKVHDPEAYARRTLYHDQVSWWRRRARAREDLVASAPERIAGGGVAEQAADRVDVWQALHRLGARQRAVLVLRYFEDLPEREVADILGCSVGTVRSQASRALARLRVVAPELAYPPVLTTEVKQ